MGHVADNRDAWWGLEKNRQIAQVITTAHEHEKYTPFGPIVVAGTGEFLIVDKPSFLPTTPNDHTVANTVQERLRRSLGESKIVAVHHLDLLTGRLLLFSRNPATRTRYQQLFQNQKITKEYECLTVMLDSQRVGETRDVTFLLDPNPVGHGIKVVETDASTRAAAKDPESKLARITVAFLSPIAADIGDVLAGSRSGGSGGGATNVSIPLCAVGCGCGHCGSNMQVGYWRLQSHTGRMHQLRVTMDWLGYPVLGEDTYGRETGAQGPSASTGSAPTYMPQLRLTATALASIDPVTGE